MMGDDYLTMARLCDNEIEKFVKRRDEEFEWQCMTGREQIIAKASFRSGFFAGFEAKFFNTQGD